MTEDQKYKLQLSLSNAIFVVNHISIGFINAKKLEDQSFSRVQEDCCLDMKKIFMPAYLKEDAEQSIKELEEAKKLLACM